jgi:hypothetical protein
MTTFEKLSAINVNDHVEKKKDLSYLSWAWAWSEVKKAYPDTKYEILETEYDEILGFMCHTSVTIEGETLKMWLPVMDGANKSMKKTEYTYKGNAWVNGKKVEVEKTVEAATMFDINKTIMRCLVKNLAMFGLGIYIYAGEDLPETPSVPLEPIAAKAIELSKLVEGSEAWSKVISYATANKHLGISAIVQQLLRKYVLEEAIVKRIEDTINPPAIAPEPKDETQVEPTPIVTEEKPTKTIRKRQ